MGGEADAVTYVGDRPPLLVSPTSLGDGERGNAHRSRRDLGSLAYGLKSRSTTRPTYAESSELEATQIAVPTTTASLTLCFDPHDAWRCREMG